MGKRSIKENKNIYQLRREDKFPTRPAACKELLRHNQSMDENRLEKIENDRLSTPPKPEEVKIMAEVYNAPDLCNYYCAHECVIGKKYVPAVEVKDLSNIILGLISALNDVNKKQERLIAISADGTIDAQENEEFQSIRSQLEAISLTVESLQLWSEKNLLSQTDA